MRIFVDMDNVLADYDQAVYEYFGFKGLHPDGLLASVGITEAQLEDMMHMDGFFRNLTVCEWAGQLLLTCEQAVGADNVCILTKPFSGQCAKEKVEWTAKHFPAYSRKLLIGKLKRFCAQPDAILIDDNEENVASFIQHGGLGIVFPNMHNSRNYFMDNPLSIITEELNAHLARRQTTKTP